MTRKDIYRGRIVGLDLETVRLPNGRELELEVVRHPGGAAVAAIDLRERRVCLLRQYRHAAGGWIWELPAGKLEPGEPPHVTAGRELEEEAGVRARQWQPLGEIVTTPGFCDEIIHLFLATGLESVSSRHEEHEMIEIHWPGLDEALAWACDGRIRDAKTLAGLFLAARRLDAGGKTDAPARGSG